MIDGLDYPKGDGKILELCDCQYGGFRPKAKLCEDCPNRKRMTDGTDAAKSLQEKP